ncbi:protein of unknown function [Methylocella tundrae]|uniref:Uncharacterized protein n=1 Tax=Methylocella tundrae TaxID=227605 RepID=A0A4U8Z0I6_METTU|nr:protein of unknown function [Methylocella tundrae]
MGALSFIVDYFQEGEEPPSSPASNI